MGNKVAPTYVTIVMGYLENKLYNIIENKYGLDHKKVCHQLEKVFR